jgi:hypothetical protein
MTPANVFLVLAFDHPTRAVESVGERMAAGLCTLGFDAAVLSLPRDAAKLAQLPPQRVCGVLSLGPMPLSLRIGERALWEHFDCPVSLYLLDAILYDMARVPVMGDFLNAARRDPRLGLVAPETGYRDWLGATLAVQWDHVPFAAFPCVQRGPLARAAAGVQPRLPRVAVIGTIGSELGGTPAGETLPGLLARVAGAHAAPERLATLHDALLAPGADAMPALTVARELGWGPERAFDRPSLGLLVAVDSWVKRHRRIRAVASLAGVPVDFYGTGWQEQFGDTPGFNYIGRVHHDHIARVLAHYRATVNFDPNWQGGVHDRVYSAAAMGTHVFTNANTGLAAATLPSDLVTTYDATAPRLAALVADSGALACDHPGGARVDVLARHNWGSRMADWLCADRVPRTNAPAQERAVHGKRQRDVAHAA